jgi:hypothetical protein
VIGHRCSRDGPRPPFLVARGSSKQVIGTHPPPLLCELHNTIQTFFGTLRCLNTSCWRFTAAKSLGATQKLVTTTQQYGYHTHSCDLEVYPLEFFRPFKKERWLFSWSYRLQKIPRKVPNRLSCRAISRISWMFFSEMSGGGRLSLQPVEPLSALIQGVPFSVAAKTE